MKQFPVELTPRTTEATILEQDAFHGVISLERKRTDRSRRPFLLMLLDFTALSGEDRRDNVVRTICSSVPGSIRETDVIGWQQRNNVLGLLFTEFPVDNRKAMVSTMLARVSGLLYNMLSFEDYNHITISHYVYPEQWDCDVAQRPSNPRLYPDIEKQNGGTKFYSAAKRTLDMLGSAVGLVALSPVFLFVALAIKLTSPGPVFFRQQRIGQFGTPFVFLKFRSMHLNNDSKIHQEYVKRLISGDAERQNINGNGQGVYKLTNDPRVTRVGALLRKTSVDELPQLYNVLRGDMSLVGPRPAIPYEVEAYESWHRRRVLEAKPGITGLWQVSGRSRVGFDEMVRMDVRYAMRRSFWLDIKILLLTPRAVMMGEGAY